MIDGIKKKGVKKVIEKVMKRDNKEKMMKGFGEEMKVEKDKDGVRNISIVGKGKIKGKKIEVKGDKQ